MLKTGRYLTRFFLPVMLFTALLLMYCTKEYSAVGKPEVVTLGGDSTGYTKARLRGSIVSDRGKPVTAYGILVSSREDFKTYDSLSCNLLSDNSFNAPVTGLLFHQTLYLKAWAKNEIGIGYGEVVAYKHKGSGITFNPNVHYDTLVDIDGNRYLTVMIDNREWMAENLKTTRYNDGTPIPHVVANEDWNELSTAAYSWYLKGEEDYKATYGALYNWWVASSGKICPVGWHVPHKQEFISLVEKFGGEYKAGDSLKEAGISHWIDHNKSNNASGFTAMPGGYRANSGYYDFMSYLGYLWSQTEANTTQGWMVIMYTPKSNCDYTHSKTTKQAGLSVRCVKD